MAEEEDLHANHRVTYINRQINLRQAVLNLHKYPDGEHHRDMEIRSSLISHGIIPNVCPNPRNGVESKEDWLFDEDIYHI